MQANSYSESLPENIDFPEGMEWMKNIVIDFSSKMSEQAIDESLSQLEGDIIALAKTCGRKTYKNTKELFKKRLMFNDKDSFSELDIYMDQVIEKMIEAYKSNMPKEEAPEVT